MQPKRTSLAGAGASGAASGHVGFMCEGCACLELGQGRWASLAGAGAGLVL